MMNRNDIERLVNGFMSANLKFAPSVLVPSAGLKYDLGLTSVDVADTVSFIETEFGFTPRIQDIKLLGTLDDLYSYIENNTR